MFLTVVTLACRGRAPSDAKQCLDHFEGDRHADARAACERAFRRSGEPRIALAWAGSLFYLERCDEVADLATRTTGHAGEAGVLYYQGLCQSRRGNRAVAEETHLRALALAQARGADLDVSRNAFALFLAYFYRGAYARALASSHMAFRHADRAGDASLTATALEGVALALSNLGDWDGARRVLDHLRRVAPTDDPGRSARYLQREGSAHLAQDRPALARAAFEESLRMAEQIGDDRMQVDNHFNVVAASLAAGERDVASRHLREVRVLIARAFPDKYKVSLPLYEARLLRSEGRPAEALERLRELTSKNADRRIQIAYERGLNATLVGETAEAEAAFEAAIAEIESMRETLAISDMKAWLLAEMRLPYEALFRLHATAGRARQAWEVVEKTKARVLLDVLLGRSAGGRDDPRAVAPNLDWLDSSLSRAELIERLLSAVEGSSMTARSLDDVVPHLTGRHLLVYFQTAESLWLLAADAGGVRLRELVDSAEQVRATNRQIADFINDLDDPRAAAALARTLVPRDMLPKPGAVLHIVADGHLRLLPFAALRDGDRFLGLDYTLAYVPSASALVASESRPDDELAAPVVLGDPRGDLPASRTEARAVADALGVPAALGSAATIAALRQADAARVLHLATHASVTSDAARLIAADGQVDAAQIVSWKLAPRVVVLASCASAATPGRRFDKEMWGSLAAAFLASGSRSVIASLWSIEDELARDLIQRFYRHGGADAPAHALAAAQRELAESGVPVSRWAPFVAIGSTGRDLRP